MNQGIIRLFFIKNVHLPLFFKGGKIWRKWKRRTETETGRRRHTEDLKNLDTAILNLIYLDMLCHTHNLAFLLNHTVPPPYSGLHLAPLLLLWRDVLNRPSPGGGQSGTPSLKTADWRLNNETEDCCGLPHSARRCLAVGVFNWPNPTLRLTINVWFICVYIIS